MSPETTHLSHTALKATASGRFEVLPDLGAIVQQWASQGPVAWLDSGGPLTDASRWCVAAGLSTAEVWGDEKGRFFREGGVSHPLPLKGFLASFGKPGPTFTPPPAAFASAWFGGLSYECGVKRAGIQAPMGALPDYYFFKPSVLVLLDRLEKRWHTYGPVDWSPETTGAYFPTEFSAGPVSARDGKAAYEAGVRRVLEYVAAGDFYQANLAQSFEASYTGQPLGLYTLLRRLNPGPFMAFLKAPGFTLVSSSPERLVSVQGARLDARPIAGTRPRGEDDAEDLLLRNDLVTSPKERAEHLMLVDLMRNDLGRVSEYGSVHVSDYARVESYARVQHLVSTVQGRLRGDMGLDELVDSIFPGGTITGCPKKRCVEALCEMEPRPRGFYTGSMGYLAPGPVADLNILIRTFTLHDSGLLEFHAGAGIVADSNPTQEYEETLHKVQALAETLGTTLI